MKPFKSPPYWYVSGMIVGWMLHFIFVSVLEGK